MHTDEKYMQRCIQLAMNGMGNVAPNPLVGCVIVHDGFIIGEGYHAVFGGPHAEVVAIQSVKDKNLLKDSTLYVNLEPCCHHGKTPPCTDLIMESGIPRVVAGAADPFAEVQGRGIARLKQAGVEVVQGVCENECKDLNKRFFTFHVKQRPYVILKWAQTLDGFIDKERKDTEPHINWITDESTRMLVHRWRSAEQSIMAGTNTILLDDPQLTVRDWHGKNPLRLVIDEKLIIPSTAKIFSANAQTVVFNAMKNDAVRTVEFVKLNFDGDILEQVLAFLHERNIQSLIVEGGRATLQSFIDAGYWDEARVFTGNCFFFGGVRAPEITGKIRNIENIGPDKLAIIVKPEH